MANPTLGNNRRVYIVTGTTTLTYTWLAGELNNAFNRTGEAVDTSDKSSDWAQFLAGKRGATASVTVHVDDTDTQQKAVLKALHNGTKVKVFIGTLTGTTSLSPSEGDVFEALITGISDTNDNGAVSSRSINLTATGEVNHYPEL